MWLVNCNSLKLENFIGSNVPAYAILSHTWEGDEVSFQELDGLCPGSPWRLYSRRDIYETTPKGYHKIYETCRLALERGIQYAWMDTCCINKESSAELTESINSMFKWYQNAVECYAFLSDLPSRTPYQDPAHDLGSCRWFTRGWTLQELIAPKEVRFYNETWTYIGTRKDLLHRLSSITNINEDALLGASAHNFSIATRMSWAARRETTRVEDLAYCLLGIFQVSMPMIYGEGANAFLRLQEEVIKRSNDLTILAWDKGPNDPAYGGVLALSPAVFANSGDIEPISRKWSDPVFAMTNKGLRFDNFKMLFTKNVERDSSDSSDSRYEAGYWPPTTSPTETRYFIPLGCKRYDKSWTAVWLRKVGPSLFIRYGDLVHYVEHNAGREAVSFYLHANIWNIRDEEDYRRREIIFVGGNNFSVEKTVPGSHWDRKDRLFFAPSEDSSLVLAVGGNIQAAVPFQLILCFVCHEITPNCVIFEAENHMHLWSWLFMQKRVGFDATWDDLRFAVPEIMQFTNQVQVYKEGKTFVVTASVYRRRAEEVLHPGSNLILGGYSIYFQIEVVAPPTMDQLQAGSSSTGISTKMTKT